MTRKSKIKGAESTMPTALLKGTLAAILTTVVGAALMSGLIIREVLKETAIGYSAMAVLLTASLVGTWIAMKEAKQKLAIVSLLTGLCYFLVLIGGNALFCRGNYEGSGVTGLVILAGAGTAILLGLKPKRASHSPVRKIRVR